MPNKKNQLLMLVPSLEQPRVIKRIIEKLQEYESIEVYGFTRKIHQVNNYDILQEQKNIKLTVVGEFSDSKYYDRIRTYFKLISTIYKQKGFQSKQLYVFGLDLRIMSALLLNSEISYEISDIMWLYKSPLRKSVLRNIDTFLAKRSHNVTFTSKGFYEGYYHNFVLPEKVIIKENKFKTYGRVSPIEKVKSDKIRIAYIGAFRYKTIIDNLIKVVVNDQRLVLNFYGDGFKTVIESIKKSVQNHENIHFHGAFKNPDNLEGIYAENNLNFVVYDNSYDNEKVAMPNKFYESGFFNIPIVCAENTYVGKRVLEQDMGWVCGIDHEEIKTFLNSLKTQDLVDCHDRIKKLDKSMFQC